MFTFTRDDGTIIKINVIGIVAWTVLVVAVLTQNLWLAVIPAVYLAADD